MDTGEEKGTWLEEAEVMSEMHVGTAVGIRSTISVFAISMPSGMGPPVKENEEGLQGRASSNYEGDHHRFAETDDELTEISTDEHGDLLLPRRAKKHRADNTPADAVVVHHHVTTLLPQVGLQVWRGALLLSDFILHTMFTSEVFNNVTALELGSGTGARSSSNQLMPVSRIQDNHSLYSQSGSIIFNHAKEFPIYPPDVEGIISGLAGLVMGRVSPLVFVTDIGEGILENCSRNVIQNVISLRRGEPTVRVRELDWRKPWPLHPADEENCPNLDKSSPYQWTPEDVKDAGMVSVFLAADVIYSEDLTTAFFAILKKLMPPNSNKVLYLAMEKRYNFSLTDLDVVAHGYKHFRTFFTIDCPRRLELDLAYNEGKRRNENLNDKDAPYNFFGQMIYVDEIPQYIRNYSRGDDLELWEIRPWKDVWK